jgi:outer membrane receptor for monomeric catechols
MKHSSEKPNSLHGGAVRPLLAFALLTMVGWAAPSHADTAATPDSKKSNSDDLQEIVVVSYKITRGSVGSLVDAAVIDIPRNLDVITPETLENQMVTNTLDILKNWAGVQRGQATPGGEHPIVRGTTAFQFLEGSFSGGAIWDAAEFLGSAELMTGPDSVQYGFLVSGGGAINYRLKRPEAGEWLDVTAQGNNWGTNKYVFDANKSFSDGYADDGLRVIGAHESIQDFRKGTKHGERESIGAMLT